MTQYINELLLSKSNTLDQIADYLNINPTIVNLLGSEGWFRIMYKCSEYAQYSYKIIKLLIENGADINWLSLTESTLLILLANKTNTFTVIKLLVESGANLNLQNIFGHTALMRACEYKQIQNAIYLLECGINAYLEDKYGHNVITCYASMDITNMIEEWMVINWNRKVVSSGFI